MVLAFYVRKRSWPGRNQKTQKGAAVIIYGYIDTIQFTENSTKKNAKFHRKGGREVGGRVGRYARPHPKSSPIQPGV